jgi:hypothetical protein
MATAFSAHHAGLAALRFVAPMKNHSQQGQCAACSTAAEFVACDGCTHSIEHLFHEIPLKFKDIYMYV